MVIWRGRRVRNFWQNQVSRQARVRRRGSVRCGNGVIASASASVSLSHSAFFLLLFTAAFLCFFATRPAWIED